MPKQTVQINFIETDGTPVAVDAEVGLSLMVAAKDHNIAGIDALCGGCCNCGTCHVILATDVPDLPPLYAGEDQVLSNLKLRESGSRLSCQVTIKPSHAGMVVRVIPSKKREKTDARTQ